MRAKKTPQLDHDQFAPDAPVRFSRANGLGARAMLNISELPARPGAEALVPNRDCTTLAEPLPCNSVREITKTRRQLSRHIHLTADTSQGRPDIRPARATYDQERTNSVR